MATDEVRASVSGTVWKVLVTRGQSVTAGEEVVILESMKMEVPQEAAVSGRVHEVRVAADSLVEEDQVLVVIAQENP